MSRKEIDALREQRDALDEKINDALMSYVAKKAKLSVTKRVSIIGKVVEYTIPYSIIDNVDSNFDNPFELKVSLNAPPIKEDDIYKCLSTLFPEYDIDGGFEMHINREEHCYDFTLTRPVTAIEIKGDLLDQQGYLVQQCNCVTVKAHGLSQSFIDRFGKKADLYGKRSKSSENTSAEPSVPGTYQIVPLNDNAIMVGVFGQWLPGKPGKWNRAYNNLPDTPDTYNDRLRYFKKALDKFANELTCDDTPVYFPYKIGCGLAGGDWTKYEEAINEFASKYYGKTYIVRLE